MWAVRYFLLHNVLAVCISSADSQDESSFLLSSYERRVGEIQYGEGSISGQIRRHYTDNYSALDRFDRFWYQIVYPYSARSWKSYFTWCVIQQALVNAYVAYMKHKNKKIPLREFYELIVDEYAAERAGLGR